MTEVKRAKLDTLTPDHANANKGTERGRYALEASLRQFGAGRSILLDRNGRIIAGNKTVETAADVGLDDVLIVETDGKQIVAVQRTDLDIDSEAGRGLAYADNRVGQLSLDWDAEQVLADLNAGVDLSALWRQDELDELLADLQPKTTEGDTEPEIDRAEELRQKWGVEPGQLWQLGEHRLICGDCTDAAVVARVMAGERFVLVTDPPYGIRASAMTMGSHQSSLPKEQRLSNVEQWDDKRPDMRPFVNEGLFSCVWGGQYFARELPVSDDWLCWHKKNDNLSFAECELAWTNYGARTRILQHHWGDEKKQHITQKPLAVMQWATEMCPDKRATVLDPFLGSGTTLIACENLGRRCRAVEIAPGYVAVALERWATHTGKVPELIPNGAT